MAQNTVFYTNPQSRGRIARWSLKEARVPCETRVDYGTTIKAPDYLAINPMGKVPAIQYSDQIVTGCTERMPSGSTGSMRNGLHLKSIGVNTPKQGLRALLYFNTTRTCSRSKRRDATQHTGASPTELAVHRV